MNKLAIFVEGLTEFEFAAALIKAVFLSGGEWVGSSNSRRDDGRRRLITLEATVPRTGEEFYVQILDCGGDSRVSSDVREDYARLERLGFSDIIAIRDVYPHDRAAAGNIRQGFARVVPQAPIATTLVLATMETEAWFLAEHTHFSRVDDSLTLNRVKEALEFDPSSDDVELRPRPSEDLATAYGLAGLLYEKTAKHIQRTVDALDYRELFSRLPSRVPSLKPLTEALARFFC